MFWRCVAVRLPLSQPDRAFDVQWEGAYIYAELNKDVLGDA